MWLKNKDIGENLGVEDIFDLTDKEIKGKFETIHLTEKKIKNYKRHESELINGEKFLYTHEDIITPIIVLCKVSTAKAIEFRHKLGFKQHDIMLTKDQSVLKLVVVALRGKVCRPSILFWDIKLIIIFVIID